ncbi:calcium-binding protein [Mesobacterium pallidum]|uniref:calcium-binding protein n=1 Tax=Mesobacterium pallidum TaxID=2872037 RepID=UPI001EE30A55|nr:calcium-binding protein [Mesobacterium pallidum]
MATFFIPSSGGGTGVQHTLAQADDILVASGVERYSENDSVIVGAGNNLVMLSPDATLATFSASYGESAIQLGENTVSASGNNSVTISDGASIISNNAGVALYGGDGHVTNFGTISAETVGVEASNGDLGVNVVMNHGAITGISIAVRVWEGSIIHNFGTASGQFFGLVGRDGGNLITNFGQVAGNAAIWMGGTGAGDDTNQFVNSGAVLGGDYGVFSNAGGIAITNSGTISSLGQDSGVATIYHNSTDTAGSYALYNTGVITGARAYWGATVTDEIENAGVILGQIDLNAGNDLYNGRNGEVTGPVSGGDGADRLYGGDEDNHFAGDAGDDELRGAGGSDTLQGGDGLDTLGGGDGDDRLDGGKGADELRGAAGEDTLFGGDWRDTLHGGSGDDTLFGGGGDDSLLGGTGDDTMTGGSGADVFVLGPWSGSDLITDFQDGIDKIDISRFGLQAGAYGTDIAPAISGAGGGSLRFDLAQMGGNGIVIIEGIWIGQVDASDFIF